MFNIELIKECTANFDSANFKKTELREDDLVLGCSRLVEDVVDDDRHRDDHQPEGNLFDSSTSAHD